MSHASVPAQIQAIARCPLSLASHSRPLAEVPVVGSTTSDLAPSNPLASNSPFSSSLSGGRRQASTISLTGEGQKGSLEDSKSTPLPMIPNHLLVCTTREDGGMRATIWEKREAQKIWESSWSRTVDTVGDPQGTREKTSCRGD